MDKHLFVGESFVPVISKAGTYDANGKRLKNWQQLINSKDIKITGMYMETSIDVAKDFSNVAKIIIDDSVKRFKNTSKKIPGTSLYEDVGTFEDCANLVYVQLPEDFVEIGTYAFQRCTSLSSINIPKGVGTIGTYCFSGCSSLASIDLSLSKCDYISPFAFSECTNLNVIFGDGKHYSSIRKGAFAGCKNLRKIPDSVGEIYEGAFSNCTSIEEVTLSERTSYIESNPFTGCTNISSMTVSPDNTKYDSRENCNAIILTNYNTIISGCKNTIIPNTVTKIGNSAFYGCTSLTEITIPDSVTDIGGYAFVRCTGLTEITIPDSVTNIATYIFTHCTNLTTIHYSGTATGAPWGAPNAVVVP